ncbi:MAG: 6-phosphogluconolactonase [Parafilimonas sp.]
MKLHISKNQDELAITVADFLVQYIYKTLQAQENFLLVLSGGNTPKKLYGLLASDIYKNKIDWSKIDVFFGDERFVPFNDERNNAKMAFETLLNHVDIPAKNIHEMQTENIFPQESAKKYQQLLTEYFKTNPKSETRNQAENLNNKKRKTPPFSGQVRNQKRETLFDLVLLGMGDDGHTLSLFPGNKEVIHEAERWCVSLWLQGQSMYRITLTAPVVNQSACIAFLVSGRSKSSALHEVLKGNYNPDLYPSQIIKPANEELRWFVDEAAAIQL